ncbi:hypothetical protein CDD82_4100 [Ophiocordyceps australis]|uniref:25S rRNA (Uridine(2843)-N(3))-methyltransferase n=1 Tax=Ophiocordyceps australis TaxID=1399860 RepID=A0A2C5ZSL8_9HYPO|nr:hypothetical protein CDD82_4100 [Ophiocordyceps australis]
MGNNTKPFKARAPPTSTESLSVDIEINSAQRLLNLFSAAFAPLLASDSLPALLQDIKQALFRRDFAAAFSRPDLLDAYAARWSPPRAVCYAAVLRHVSFYLNALVSGEAPQLNAHHHDATELSISDRPGNDKLHQSDLWPTAYSANQQLTSPNVPHKKLRMLAMGGCAAEVVAFASYLCDASLDGSLILVDSAPWSAVTSLLQTTIVSPLPLSKYASAAARAANQPFLSPASRLSLSFCQTDVLSLSRDALSAMTTNEPLVVTLLFTLNELYTIGGIAQTTKFLGLLGHVLAAGSLLLVIDSPGSYSEAKVGKADKRYPMRWLLQHTLLDTKTTSHAWEKLESHDSIWCRLPAELSYPIQLEDMRYQMHLYRIRKT